MDTYLKSERQNISKIRQLIKMREGKNILNQFCMTEKLFATNPK